MKRLVLLTILAVSMLYPGLTKAQDVIPNGNFNSWGGGTPTGWSVFSGVASEVQGVDYVKGTDEIFRPTYDGKNCISMACGIANSVLTQCVIRTKFAMTAQDAYLVFNWAYIQGGTNANAPYFAIKAFHHNANGVHLASDTCLNGVVPFSAFSTLIEPWSVFSIHLAPSYSSTTLPDSAIITIANQGYIQQLDAGTVLFLENIYFSAAQGAGINAELAAKNNVMAYPNPFSQSTTIHYNLGANTDVNLAVYDMQGREVSTLVSGNQPAGAHDVNFIGDGMKNGIYFYRLQTSEGVETGKLILSK